MQAESKRTWFDQNVILFAFYHLPWFGGYQSFIC